MEDIKTFDIEVDITDRERLYDYGNGQYVERPASGKWSDSAIESLKHQGGIDHVDPEDEAAFLKLKLMDKSLTDSRLLEKKFEDNKKGDNLQSSLASSSTEELPNEIVFGANYGMLQSGGCSLPRRVLPIYQPGDVVKGAVLLDLKQSLQANVLKVNFSGMAIVNIRTYHQYGYHDHKGTDEYINEDVVLWQKVDGKSKEVSDSFSLLSVNTKQTSTYLPPGYSRFPFEFAIPLEGVGSVPPLKPSTVNYAFVSYRLKAVIDKGKICARGNAVTHRGLWVERPFDIGKDLENLSPVNAEQVQETGVFPMKSGKIICKAHLPKKGYVRGETVPLLLDVDNQSKSEINSIKARVVLQGKAKTGAGRMCLRQSIGVKASKCQDGPISAGNTPSYKWDLPLDFSESSVDSNLVPVGTLEGCKLIDVHYEVVIKMTRKGLHRNMEINIPIVVGSENSSTVD